MGKLILPPPLRAGDTIGFFSPSSAATAWAPKRFERAKAFVERRGFRLRAGNLTGKNDGYRSGSIRERADELNALIRDPEVRAVMSVIGGYNSNALLPYLDYDALRKDPKIVVGYSDVTALLLGIHAQTGLVTFYGPALVASLGEFPPLAEETWDAFLAVTTGAPSLPYAFPRPLGWTDEFLDWETQDRPKVLRDNRWVPVLPGRVEGRIVGGNLNTLSGIWGSPYMPEIGAGDLLFLEDSLLDAAVVERSFNMLRLNGIFDRVGGVILGKHELFKDRGTGRTPADILLEVLDGRPVPLLAEFDCCHTHPMLALPLGIRGRLDVEAQTVELLEPWLGPRDR